MSAHSLHRHKLLLRAIVSAFRMKIRRNSNRRIVVHLFGRARCSASQTKCFALKTNANVMFPLQLNSHEFRIYASSHVLDWRGRLEHDCVGSFHLITHYMSQSKRCVLRLFVFFFFRFRLYWHSQRMVNKISFSSSFVSLQFFCCHWHKQEKKIWNFLSFFVLPIVSIDMHRNNFSISYSFDNVHD